MLKEDELIGAMVIYRQEVQPFTNKQIALVQNFAAQAVMQALNKLGADPPLTEDGKNGQKTRAAVSQFQRENGLQDTGLVDRATVEAIERKLKPVTRWPQPTGPNEIATWLERLVMLVERLKAQTTIPPPASQQPHVRTVSRACRNRARRRPRNADAGCRP
jgi:hypothetical protein